MMHWFAACTFLLSTSVSHAARRRSRRHLLSTTKGAESEVNPKGGTEVTIHCSVPPLFDCDPQNLEACRQALEDEQDTVWASITEIYPDAILVARTTKIFNDIYLYIPGDTDENEDDDLLLDIAGVSSVSPTGYFEVDEFDATDELAEPRGRYLQTEGDSDCTYTGKGVRIAVLDTGIDYTHDSMGGPGTEDAYRAAYGTGPESLENTQRDGLFPTERVVEGYDFLGDLFEAGNPNTTAEPDDDPIDGYGHGTAVADVIVTLAEDVKLLAVKVCTQRCSEPAILQGIEYALDPNDDGRIDDKVDIIHMSLGRRAQGVFYSQVSFAIERAFDLGVLTVTGAGNYGNIPYVMGDLAGTINALTVGATTVRNENFEYFAASYTARGPTDLNILKPELSAPGGYYLLAEAGTGTGTSARRGTSIASPFATAAAAALIEKCPECSPAAIKTLLVNNAARIIQPQSPEDGASNATEASLAPVSLTGSGVLSFIYSAGTDIMVYSMEDNQPTMSLGLMNLDDDLTLTRSLEVVKLVNDPLNISVSVYLREKPYQNPGALSISVSRDSFQFDEGCSVRQRVNVTFDIDASLAPSNHMTSAGRDGINATFLDRNEFDGWIVISYLEKAVNVPFHMVLRKAAKVTLSQAVLPSYDNLLPPSLPVGLVNEGEGVAQIDAYELIHVSADDPEPEKGSGDPSSDLRYVGYRILRSTDSIPGSGCQSIFEVAFTTWERQTTLQLGVFFVDFDLMQDAVNWTLFNAGFLLQSPYTECRLYNDATEEFFCTGFAPDHSTNSRNTVLRACVDDMFVPDSGLLTIHVGGFVFPSINATDPANMTISMENPSISAPSYDISPGERLDSMEITGTGFTPDGNRSLGLLLITNAYRRQDSTGAATPETEAIAIVRPDVDVPREATIDTVTVLRNATIRGPACGWHSNICVLTGNRHRSRTLRVAYDGEEPSLDHLHLEKYIIPAELVPEEGVCWEQEIIRLAVPTNEPTWSRSPSQSPSQTSSPSPFPSMFPSNYEAPSFVPSELNPTPTDEVQGEKMPTPTEEVADTEHQDISAAAASLSIAYWIFLLAVSIIVW